MCATFINATTLSKPATALEIPNSKEDTDSAPLEPPSALAETASSVPSTAFYSLDSTTPTVPSISGLADSATTAVASENLKNILDTTDYESFIKPETRALKLSS